jgi:hypothetical protein
MGIDSKDLIRRCRPSIEIHVSAFAVVGSDRVIGASSQVLTGSTEGN